MTPRQPDASVRIRLPQARIANREAATATALTNRKGHLFVRRTPYIPRLTEMIAATRANKARAKVTEMFSCMTCATRKSIKSDATARPRDARVADCSRHR
jgi:hypothetical protein